MYLSPTNSNRGINGMSTGEPDPVAGSDLNNLLLRCSELSNEIARISDLVKRLAHGNGQTKERRTRKSRRSKRSLNSAQLHNRHPVKQGLERACRIALMETTEPMSIETVYDRIERRGSFTFVGYSHPFRAIVLALNGMVKQGEASLLCEAEHRRWRWGTDRPDPESGGETPWSL